MELLPCIIFFNSSADPRLLGALRQTLSPAGGSWGECCDWDERMDETNTFVRVSLRLELCSRKVLDKQYLFCDAFNSFFCLEQETVRHPRYMI